MFFPIGDDQVKGGHYPFFSYTILVINIVVYFYQVSLPEYAIQDFFHLYSTIPANIEGGHQYYTLLTSMFLHGGMLHLISNMLFLWVFADNIEATIGNLPFLAFYIAGGVLASLAHVYFNPGSEIPSVGASGAISAVMGAYLIMFPHSKVKVIVFLIFILRRITMSALAFLGIWIVIQVFSTFQSMGTTVQGGGTAWFAHLGGVAFGLLMGSFFRPQVQRLG